MNIRHGCQHSQICKLRSRVKLDLVGCLYEVNPSQQNTPNPLVQVAIPDLATVVNMVQTGAAKTFLEFAQSAFSTYILSQHQQVRGCALCGIST